MESITDEGLVTCVEDHLMEFTDGHVVTFSEVEGMVQLNGSNFEVERKGKYKFQLKGDLAGLSAHTKGGIATQVKLPKEIAFKSLAASMEDPGEILLSDFAKMSAPYMLHALFCALQKFRAAHGGSLPTLAALEEIKAL